MGLIERDDPERRWFIAVDKLTGETLDVADTRSGAIAGVEHVEVTFASHLEGAVGILRELAQMPLRASGKDYDRLVKAARAYLPEYADIGGQ